jgi:hypothetical protein
MIQAEITRDVRRCQQLRERIARDKSATPEQLAVWFKGNFTAKDYRSWNSYVQELVLEMNPTAVDAAIAKEQQEAEHKSQQDETFVRNVLAGKHPGETSATLGLEEGQIAFVNGHPELTTVGDGSSHEAHQSGLQNSKLLLDECIARNWLTSGENLQKVFVDLATAGKLTLRINGELLTGTALRNYVYLHSEILNLHSAPSAPDPDAALSADEYKTKHALPTADAWTSGDPNAKNSATSPPARTVQIYETAIQTFRSFHPEFIPSDFARTKMLGALGSRPLIIQNLEAAFNELSKDAEFQEHCIDRSAKVTSGGLTITNYEGRAPGFPTPVAEYEFRKTLAAMSSSAYHERYRQDPDFRARVDALG